MRYDLSPECIISSVRNSALTTTDNSQEKGTGSLRLTGKHVRIPSYEYVHDTLRRVSEVFRKPS